MTNVNYNATVFVVYRELSLLSYRPMSSLNFVSKVGLHSYAYFVLVSTAARGTLVHQISTGLRFFCRNSFTSSRIVDR